MSIENYIISNLKTMDYKDLLNEINKSNSEEALPGLGVLFKIYFKTLDNASKEGLTKEILNSIR